MIKFNSGEVQLKKNVFSTKTEIERVFGHIFETTDRITAEEIRAAREYAKKCGWEIWYGFFDELLQE